MKKLAGELKVGQVVQIPKRQFAPLRRGWNGWLFSVGIVREFGTSKRTGKQTVKVEIPVDNYAQKWIGLRDEPHEGERKTVEMWLYREHIFEPNFAHSKMLLEHPREYWKDGCYDAETEFLIDKGILADHKPNTEE